MFDININIMSAQCWCYNCAGRIVSRKTWVAHGRKDKPDEPLEQDEVDLVSMVDHDEEPPPVPESDSDGDLPPEDDIINDALGLGLDDAGEQQTGRAKLTAAEVTLFLLDWMCTHKVTDTATSRI